MSFNVIAPILRLGQEILLTSIGSICCLYAFTQADPINCNMEAYTYQPGLIAHVEDETLTITWDGKTGDELQISFILQNGIPTISELAIRQGSDDWQILVSDAVPSFGVVSGLRRVTQQQTEPLEELGIELTTQKLEEIKWEAFWDAPLYIKDELPPSHQSSIPASEAFLNHPGMPRNPDEVVRSAAEFNSTDCEVRTNGSRIEVIFPGVKAGIFNGYLQYDIFKGSNLIRQMIVAKTDHTSAAFKYEGGIQGLVIGDSSKVVWRDLANHWQDYRFGGPQNQDPVKVYCSNRLIAAELQNGSISMFPPPHSFYWARESEQNLGYGWYRKDDQETFSLGIRQAETEEDPEFFHNFALYNARPGTWQRMPIFICIDAGGGSEAITSALAFTHGDQFKSIPGHKVMGSHYHVGMVKRLEEKGGLDQRLNDIGTMKGVGVDIYGVIDGVRGPARKDKGEPYLDALDTYYEAARSQSDKGFLVMPNDENSTGGRKPFLGGHYDILYSHPVYWRPERLDGQPVREKHPKYGAVYNLGSAADMMKMTELENAIISMPHPRAKRSTGYPDAIKDEPHFLHKNYFGLGYRWGMGIDASEKRLGEYRFLNMWDEVNNWMAAKDLPPKFALAISEARSDYGDRGKPPYDDVYGMAPVNYLRIDEIPTVDNMTTIIDALKQGEYFITSGEVFIPYFHIEGTSEDIKIIAEVEWTFPLEFVEVVWGDGENTDRQIISTTDLVAFGKKQFEIPFNANGKKWVRFAAWDVATNGAMVQPVWLGE